MNGAAMGFAPAVIDEMSFWQFEMAYEGFRRANDPDSENEMTEAEFDQIAPAVLEGPAVWH